MRLKSGFYPFSGPAGRGEDPGRFPTWYYPNAESIEITAYTVQGYFNAIDIVRRRLFGALANDENAVMWFLGRQNADDPLLPTLASAVGQDERTLAASFGAGAAAVPQTYPELLLKMCDAGVATRLLEWTTNSVNALIAAVGNFSTAGAGTTAAVWCLNPARMNLVLHDNNEGAVLDSTEGAAAALFGDATGETRDGPPFAAYITGEDGRRRPFVVFPRQDNVPLQLLPGSAAFLSRIELPVPSRVTIAGQIRRYGLATA